MVDTEVCKRRSFGVCFQWCSCQCGGILCFGKVPWIELLFSFVDLNAASTPSLSFLFGRGHHFKLVPSNCVNPSSAKRLSIGFL